MATRSKKRGLYFAAQTGDIETDPDDDGNDVPAKYKQIKIEDLGVLSDDFTMDESGFLRGKNRVAPMDAGVDGASFTFSTVLQGVEDAAATGSEAMPADDWLSLILENVFGAPDQNVSTGVGTGSAAGTLVLDADTLAAQDLVPVQSTGTNSGRAQWRPVTNAASPYTVGANWAATPDGTEIAFGTDQYRHSTAVDSGGGNQLAAYYLFDDLRYTLLGGRITSLKITLAAMQKAKIDASIQFDSKVRGPKSSEATFLAGAGPMAGVPIRGTLSPLFWGGTAYATSSIELDFGLSTTVAEATSGPNGRSAIEVISADPVITISPPHGTNWEDDFRAGTQRSLLIQFGGGVFDAAADRLNTCCFFANAAQAKSVQITDDAGRARSAIQLTVVDAGEVAANTDYTYWVFARA